MMTIKAIKQALSDMTSIEMIEASPFYNDERKGVQQAIQSRRKQIEKAQQLEQQYADMCAFENEILAKHPQALICGVDEVGRGPLAGPVVACAVILQPGHRFIGLNDSKKMSRAKRVVLETQLQDDVYAYAYGEASVEEIDQYNIYEATKIAMQRAIDGLSPQPTHLLIDAMTLPNALPQTSIIKGDARSVSIAASSVLAKEYRDRYMTALAKQYPGYDFENNAGYGTKAHLEGLSQHGVTPEHRRTFEPIKSMVNKTI